MSVLMHLCLACRHRATSHDGGDRGYSGCPCCRAAGDIDPEPRLVATWSSPGGRLEPLYPPGSVWNAGTMHQLRLCGCDRCLRRYGALTGAGPADAEPAALDVHTATT